MYVTAPKDTPWQQVSEPCAPADIETRWVDPEYRARKAEYELSRTYFGGEAFPHYDTQIGPGSLAVYLGSEPQFAEGTVWFDPCVHAPENHPELKFDPEQPRFLQHLELIKRGVEISDGRFLVGMPDLIENIDVLASLRGSEQLLEDLIDRPDFVTERLEQINRAYFEAFDAIREIIRDDCDWQLFSAFGALGPGRAAKVQCDAAAMISPTMFRRFVVPAMRRQCAWLDFSLFHLDGEDSLCHLDALLEMPELTAIEWTPVFCWAGEGGGHPKWYDLYRRILAAGKGVQAISVGADQVIPLLDAVGGAGMYITTGASSESEARQLAEKVEAYR